MLSSSPPLRLESRGKETASHGEECSRKRGTVSDMPDVGKILVEYFGDVSFNVSQIY